MNDTAIPMRLRLQREGSDLVLKALIGHVMETGLRKDAEGAVVPAWFILQVEVWVDQSPVMQADWGPAVSATPFLQLRLSDVGSGSRVRVVWRDTRGIEREDSLPAP